MISLAQLGLIYVYLLVIILLVGLGYVGFRLVNWAVTKITDTAKGNKQAPNRKLDGDPAWMRLAFLSATILFLAIFTGGALKVIGVGGEGHDHQAHSQNSSQTAMNGQYSAGPSMQLQQYQANQYQISQYQFNQYQFQSQLNLISNQLSQMEATLNGLAQ